MKRTLFFKLSVCVLSLCIMPVMAQTKYHVNVNKGDDTNDGLKWASAFENIQAALDKVEANDTILVAAGVYFPTKKYAESYKDGTPTTEKACSFVIPNGVVLLGGFPANQSDETGMSSRNWIVNTTILSGDLNGDDLYGRIDDNAHHIIILFDASPRTVIDGFYLYGGNSNATETAYYKEDTRYHILSGCGAAIYSYSFVSTASPTLRNLVIQSNNASNKGGGFFNYSQNDDASPEITNVEFIDNKVTSSVTTGGGRGGGLCIEGRTISAKITNVIITGNSALSNGFSYGGGAYFRAINDCRPEIQNTLIAGNISNAGGGIFFNSTAQTTAPVLTNVTISGNKAVARNNTDGNDDGGGMTVFASTGDASPVIQNTVICDNAGDVQKDILVIGKGGTNPTYSYSFVKNKELGGTNLAGNTSTELMFAFPGNAELAPFGKTRYNYQLRVESPLINKGNNMLLSLTNDLAGQNRIYGGTIDIGAYESQGTVPLKNENSFEEKSVWSYNGSLYVRINTSASLYIYSIDGKLVKHINNLGSGSYQFSLPGGIYIVTLSNGVSEKVVIR